MIASLVIVSGSIAPYSSRLFESIAVTHGINLHVLTCAGLEPNRHWMVPSPKHYRLKLLRGVRIHKNLSHFYFNPGIVFELAAIRPTGIIVGSFSPTMIMAGVYALATGTPLGISTDGSIQTDPGEHSCLHRWVRSAMLPRATFGIGASEASTALLSKYGLSEDRCEIVPLIPAWDAPKDIPGFNERPFDVLFCGGITQDKGALFFCDVLERCKARGYPLRARIVGEGELRQAMEERLRSLQIDAVFDGYLQASELAAAYASSKLLLFPSKGDAWGLVANEATLCGAPVIGSPHAISSIELVDRYSVGQVLPLDADSWSGAVIDILSDPEKWSEWQKNRIKAQESFSLGRAVKTYGDVLKRVYTAAK